MNKLIKDALILTLITLIAGVALGTVYEVTKAPIEAANLATIQAAYKSLFEDAADFVDDTDFDSQSVSDSVNKDLEEAELNKFAQGDVDVTAHIEALDSSGDVIGDIITVVSHKGYGGDITLSVGIDTNGSLVGYEITQISETPGLGMKSTEEKFSSQFAGLGGGFLSVTKNTPNEGEVEAISGATITSRAVTNAVNAAISYYDSLGKSGDKAEDEAVLEEEAATEDEAASEEEPAEEDNGGDQ